MIYSHSLIELSNYNSFGSMHLNSNTNYRFCLRAAAPSITSCCVEAFVSAAAEKPACSRFSGSCCHTALYQLSSISSASPPPSGPKVVTKWWLMSLYVCVVFAACASILPQNRLGGYRDMHMGEHTGREAN